MTPIDNKLNTRLNDLYSFFALIREMAQCDPQSLKVFVSQWSHKRLAAIYESVGAQPSDVHSEGADWLVYILPTETLEIAFARTKALHSYFQSVM